MKVLSNELKIAAEGVDPFTVRKLEKKQRIVKNQMHQIKNLEKAQKEGYVPSGIPFNIDSNDNKKKNMKGKVGTIKAIEQIQRSTASLGKFDKKLENEPDRIIRGKKRQFKPNEKAGESEKALKILKHIDIK